MKQVQQIRDRLLEMREPDFQKFSAALIPGETRMLGVRLPALRALAKQLAKDEDWRAYLSAAPSDYFEEIMLRGMIIGAVRISAEERLAYIRSFVPEIDNWSVCDSFCAGLKFTKQNPDQVLAFLRPYCASKREFEVRFGYVMLMDFFLTEEYVGTALQEVYHFSHTGYYAKMAVAWLLATALAKFPEQALPCLNGAPLDDFTYFKAIQKALESYRVSDEIKQTLRDLRVKRRELSSPAALKA